MLFVFVFIFNSESFSHLGDYLLSAESDFDYSIFLLALLAIENEHIIF